MPVATMTGKSSSAALAALLVGCLLQHATKAWWPAGFLSRRCGTVKLESAHVWRAYIAFRHGLKGVGFADRRKNLFR